jgi:hypothetical protein
MANFLRPGYEVAASYASKANGLAYVYVPLGLTRDVALWGGSPDGSPLWVQFNDFDSVGCPAKCVEIRTQSTTYRFFTITPRHLGNTILEARLGGRTGPVWDFTQVVVEQAIAWGAKVSHEFKTKVIAVCKRLNVEPDYLMTCMAFETGRTFSPSIHNAAGSGAVGLIQFMGPTAVGLGTRSSALAVMGAVQQLDYVESYMSSQARAAGAALRSLEDVYMAILYPAAIGKPDTYVLFRSGTVQYQQNAGLDLDADGVITKFEATSGVRALWSGGGVMASTGDPCEGN